MAQGQTTQTWVSVVIENKGLDGLLAAVEKMAAPPDFEAIGRFELTLAHMFAATQAVVHVLSGGLKASGHPSSDFDGSSWTGTIEYARDPGIFELALGDQPSIMHPEGGHFFFDPAYDQLDEIEEDLAAWFDECMETGL